MMSAMQHQAAKGLALSLNRFMMYPKIKYTRVKLEIIDYISLHFAVVKAYRNLLGLWPKIILLWVTMAHSCILSIHGLINPGRGISKNP